MGRGVVFLDAPNGLAFNATSSLDMACVEPIKGDGAVTG
jgi:hypothetical protein